MTLSSAEVSSSDDAAPMATLIESLDHEGRGVAHRDGKTIFVEGALPGERVTLQIIRRKPSYEIATVDRVLVASPARTQPRCAHFGRCGGCSLQHVDLATQVAAKQRVLEDALWHIGKVHPDVVLPAIHGMAWQYRHRARFTVRHVPKKRGTLVGFHEKRSSYVADMTSCEIVPPRISTLLPLLRRMIDSLSIRRRLPQIELSIGEGADVLVFRILDPPSAEDEQAMRGFAEQFGLHIYLQSGGPNSVRALHPSAGALLYYTLPEFDLHIDFAPSDFTQVNHAVNAVLVRRAVSLLAPAPGERIADMFCGVGNFALPIARCGAHVIGIEANEALVCRARANAGRNGLATVAHFEARDLLSLDSMDFKDFGALDRMMIDPPRDGAMELVKSLGSDGPHRIVYVSCNPATLARDAGVLVHAKGYVLEAAGIVNMFPQTAHVESLAVFEKKHT
jgi:23S rRNA (uracil1939-C5)-methyltransferase